MTMSTHASLITKETLIPDLLRAAPQVRPVFDRYGLRGCGGSHGPVETLDFFAKAHEVPLEGLLSELHAAMAEEPGEPAPSEPAESLADTIYRPFFKAGIAVVLTFGAVWGAYLLLRIAFGGSFTAVGIHEVNAHGQAQIFGWVGLFVMGFAYQAFPRFKHSSLPHPRLALATLWLMLAGIALRSIFEPLASHAAGLGLLAEGGAALEITAIALFVWQIVRMLITCGKPLAFYDLYILAALGWFLVQGLYEGIYLWATLGARRIEELLPLVATYQGSLRDIQIHGFAMLMILGVSQRIFHNFYGLPAPNRRLSVAALVAINLAIIGEVLGQILMRTAGHGWATLWYGSVVLLTVSLAVLVWSWHLFARAEEADRSLKFLRAAHVWLFISFAMLAALPLYQFVVLPHFAPRSLAALIGFSHAYSGAIRHAITVGFISLMIVGVAAKVVPTLSGVDVRSLSPLWGPFVLLNVGCAMRVGFQTLTDFTAAAQPLSGVSGLLEVTALALWGAHLWRLMSARAESAEPEALPAAFVPGGQIVGAHIVGQVIDACPELVETFVAHGFKPLSNPILRRTLARHVTIAGACRKLSIDEPALLADLNGAQASAQEPSTRAAPQTLAPSHALIPSPLTSDH
jgi:hypothetical protein